MLPFVIGDRAHALGDRLVLQVDAVDAAVDRVVLLGGAIDAPVVARIRRHPPASQPVGRVGQHLAAAAGAADRRAVLEGRLRQRHRRRPAFPPQVAEHRVAVVERHPAARVHVAAELAVGRLRPERKQEVAEAPVGATRPGLAIAGVLRAPGRFRQVVLRRAVGDGVEDRLILGEIVRIDMAGVQEAEMRGVDLALERLQPVAVALDEADADLVLGNVQDLEGRQRRSLGARSHVDPDDAGALHDLVGFRLHLLLEARRRQARHVHAVAGDVELPAVIDAADPALLVASEEQRGTAVRAAVVHHADPALAVAKRDQLLAEQHQANGRPVARELRGERRRDPVAPHQLAHHGARADARQLHAFLRLRRRHPLLPIRRCRPRAVPRTHRPAYSARSRLAIRSSDAAWRRACSKLVLAARWVLGTSPRMTPECAAHATPTTPPAAPRRPARRCRGRRACGR